MYFRKLSIFAVLALVLSFSACQKDFNEMESDSSSTPVLQADIPPGQEPFDDVGNCERIYSISLDKNCDGSFESTVTGCITDFSDCIDELVARELQLDRLGYCYVLPPEGICR